MRPNLFQWAMLTALVLSMSPGAMAVPASPVGDVYALPTCPVSGEKLSEMDKPIVKHYDGREVRFCCKKCVKKFEKDPAGYWAKIDAQIIARQKDKYPLDTCVITGESLDGMGGGVDYIYGNRLVRFCCKGCVNKFEKDPAPSLAKLDKAVIEQQVAAYPLKTCVVSGDALDIAGEPLNFVAGNQLVRFCCKGCVRKFKANPAMYLEKLSAPSGEGSAPKPKSHAEGSGSH